MLSVASICRKRGGLVLLAAICTFLWGCAFPAVKIGYQLFDIGSDDVAGMILFAGIRFFLAGVATLLIGSLAQKRFLAPKASAWPGITLLGLLQTGLQYLLFYVGLAHTSGVRGSILNATSTFFTVLVAGIIWRKKEPLTGRKMLGCLLGFSGVLLVNLGSGLNQPFTLLGDGFILLSSFSLAIGAPLTKVITRKTDSVTVTGWQLTIGGVALLLAGFLMQGRLAWAGWQGVALIAFQVFISAVAFTVWTELLKYNPVSRVSIYNFLIPIFGVSLSSLLLGEGLPGLSSLGALVLVCLGIVVVNREKAPASSSESDSSK